jgi:hypothetical protein
VLINLRNYRIEFRRSDIFNKALKLYKQYIKKLKYLYVYMHLNEFTNLNDDVVGYMKSFV